MKHITQELLKFKKSGYSESIDGKYFFPHYKINGYLFCVIASTGLGWDHVSVSLIDAKNSKMIKSVERCPTWEDMCYIKDLFFDTSETVVQYHPPKESYVNNHKYCLHLWRNQNIEIEVPKRILVGI